MVAAPPPVEHIAGGRYAPDFGSQVQARKYGWHEPVDRQRRAMATRGHHVTTHTLWDQNNAIGGKIEPVDEALRDHILGADVIGVDETAWRLINRKLVRKWWVWAIHGGDSVYYRAQSRRSAQIAAEVIIDYKGVIVSDRYKAHQTLARRRPDLVLAMCWAHVRRKFVEAEPN